MMNARFSTEDFAKLEKFVKPLEEEEEEEKEEGEKDMQEETKAEKEGRDKTMFKRKPHY